MATVLGQAEDVLAGAVALAAAGDEVAFATIVRAHHDDMTRVAFLVCGDLDLADEAVQTAWTIAWRRLGSHLLVGDVGHEFSRVVQIDLRGP